MTGKSFMALFLLFGIHPSPSAAQTEGSKDVRVVEQIRASLNQYVEVFNRADAEGLAQFWVEDATYVDSSGNQIIGRAEILGLFKELFANNPGLKLSVADTRIEPASEGWAYESGTDVLTYADGTIEESSYTAVLKKIGDGWLIQSAADVEPDAIPSHYGKLRILEWLIGSWKDKGDGIVIETTHEWSSKRNSIRGEFSIIVDGALEKDGIVVIGWDPIEETIRSWMFDSDGGTAEAVWYERDGKWFAKALHILPDGRTGSSTRVFEKLDGKTLRWRAINREVDGEMLPSIGPITLTRVESGN